MEKSNLGTLYHASRLILRKVFLQAFMLFIRVWVACIFWHVGMKAWSDLPGTIYLLSNECKISIIPPQLGASLLGYVCLISSILIAAGLFSRLSALVMLITLSIAPCALIGFNEPIYIGMLLTMVLLYGGGLLSFDRWIKCMFPSMCNNVCYYTGACCSVRSCCTNCGCKCDIPLCYKCRAICENNINSCCTKCGCKCDSSLCYKCRAICDNNICSICGRDGGSNSNADAKATMPMKDTMNFSKPASAMHSYNAQPTETDKPGKIKKPTAKKV